MYILAVRPIESGAELTIDYRWSYSCVAERQENLQESYGFTCTCRSCTVQPDLTRPFACEDGDCPGPVFPIGPGSSWKCSFCSKVPKESRIKQFLAQEAQAKTSVTNSATKKAFFARKDCLLREEHYIFFRAVDEEVAPLASRGIDPLPSIQYLVACIEKLLPENHASRATFYEMYAEHYLLEKQKYQEGNICFYRLAGLATRIGYHAARSLKPNAEKSSGRRTARHSKCVKSPEEKRALMWRECVSKCRKYKSNKTNYNLSFS